MTLRRLAAFAVVIAFALVACGDAPPRASSSPPPADPIPSESPSRKKIPRAPKAKRSPSPAPSPTQAVAPPASVARAACGRDGATLRTFHVAVHDSLKRRTTERAFAGDVRAILCDERSWIAAGTVRWAYRPSSGVLIQLLPPDDAERRCMELIGLSVRRRYSCAGIDEVVINSARWFGGAPYDWGPVRAYRQMLINHELGHILRLRHQLCEREGAPAPVMMQQSKTMTSPNGKTCRANPWPLPDELARLRR